MEVLLNIHHGGYFRRSDAGMTYHGGRNFKLPIDPELISFPEIHDHIMELGYNGVTKVMYLELGLSITHGLRSLLTDADALSLIKLFHHHYVVEIYMEAINDPIIENEIPLLLDANVSARAQDKEIQEDVAGHENEAVQDNVTKHKNGAVQDNIVAHENEKMQDNVATHGNEALQDTSSEDISQEDADSGLEENLEDSSSDEEMLNDRNYCLDKVDEAVVIYGDDDDEAEPFVDCGENFEIYVSDYEDEGRNDAKSSRYNPECNHKNLKFTLGMTFKTRKEFQEAVAKYAILNGCNIKWKKSCDTRMLAKCDNCSWLVAAAQMQREKTFIVRRIGDDHTCVRNLKNRQATSKWIAAEYVEKYRGDHPWSAKQIQDDLRHKWFVDVRKELCYKAKSLAMKMLEGTQEQHYAKLASYLEALRQENPEGTFKLDVHRPRPNDPPIFKRVYIGFPELRRGFLEGCRRIIGLDGTFLKGAVDGEVLTAVGVDGNNQLYPISWAIVENENERSWTWFIEILASELGISEGLNFAIISDQHKGLENAVAKLLPFVEHRNCARHIFTNWSKKHKGEEFKRLFWKVSNATYEDGFRKALNELKDEDENAFNDFLKVDSRYFCKAFIRPLPRCDVTINNISESFNHVIKKMREKPIIDLLESVRQYTMNRIFVKQKKLKKLKTLLCPRILTLLNEIRDEARACIVRIVNNKSFEVGIRDEGFIVHLDERNCDCRGWQISGIPCVHAMACIFFINDNPDNYVDEMLTRSRCLRAYQYCMKPLIGPQRWPNVQGPPILPPGKIRMLGRPKKNRRKGKDEVPSISKKLSKRGIQMQCRICFEYGHNSRTCPKKDNPPPRPTKLPVKMGRRPSNKEGKHSCQPVKRRKLESTNATQATNSDVLWTSCTTQGTPIPASQASNITETIGNNAQNRSATTNERGRTHQGFSVYAGGDIGNLYMRMPMENSAKTISGAAAVAAVVRNLKKGTSSSTNKGKEDKTIMPSQESKV